MAESIFTIEDRNIKELFRNVAGRIEDMAPAMRSFGEYMIRETYERFNKEEDPEGNPWKPLSAITLKHKKHTKILTESSNLRDRIVYEADSKSLTIGTNVIYSSIHQLGGQAGKNRAVKIDARPYLGFNDQDQEEFLQNLNNYVLLERI